MKRKRLDLTSLELGEIEFFEQVTGLDIVDFLQGKVAGIVCTMATIVIQERRTNPDYSMDDARKLKLMDVEFEEEEADPTEAAVPPKPRPKPKRKAAS